MNTLKSIPTTTSSSLTTLLLLLLYSSPALAQAQNAPLTDDSKCGCYLTKSTNDTFFFSEHRFFDFRSLSKYANVPAPILDYSASASAEVTSEYFTSSTWKDFWYVGSWNNSGGRRSDATVSMTNSPSNVYIESSDPSSSSSKSSKSAPPTFLTLRTQRMPTFQSAAEIESASAKFQFLSMRVLARTLGGKGAITAMFTYRDAPALADVQEADIEIRTSDYPPNVIHYTNQPAYTDEGEIVPRATKNATMPAGLKWSDWAVHRLDWTPGYTAWYVNDVLVARSEFQVPRDLSNIILNAWSDGGRWTGNMTENDAAYLQVQWFEIVYNTTEEVGTKFKKAKGKKQVDQGGACAAVCSVDGTGQLGKPAMLWNNGVGRVGADGARGLLISVVMGLVVFLMI